MFAFIKCPSACPLSLSHSDGIIHYTLEFPEGCDLVFLIHLPPRISQQLPKLYLMLGYFLEGLFTHWLHFEYRLNISTGLSRWRIEEDLAPVLSTEPIEWTHPLRLYGTPRQWGPATLCQPCMRPHPEPLCLFPGLPLCSQEADGKRVGTRQRTEPRRASAKPAANELYPGVRVSRYNKQPTVVTDRSEQILTGKNLSPSYVPAEYESWLHFLLLP